VKNNCPAVSDLACFHFVSSTHSAKSSIDVLIRRFADALFVNERTGGESIAAVVNPDVSQVV
jgi:hypothetical protein